MMYGYGLDGFCDSAGQSFMGSSAGTWTVMGMMGFGLLLLAGLAIWFVVSQRDTLAGAFAAPQQQPHGNQAIAASQDDLAEAIARERFARGEIDREEYDRILATLRSS